MIGDDTGGLRLLLREVELDRRPVGKLDSDRQPSACRFHITPDGGQKPVITPLQLRDGGLRHAHIRRHRTLRQVQRTANIPQSAIFGMQPLCFRLDAGQ